jgi:hypothetical protein
MKSNQPLLQGEDLGRNKRYVPVLGGVIFSLKDSSTICEFALPINPVLIQGISPIQIPLPINSVENHGIGFGIVEIFILTASLVEAHWNRLCISPPHKCLTETSLPPLNSPRLHVSVLASACVQSHSTFLIWHYYQCHPGECCSFVPMRSTG